MINDLILRTTYDGVVTDLDVTAEVPMRIDMSTVESQEFGKLFGVGSQTFNLPGTKKNNKFFNHAYSVTAEDIPAFYNTLPVSVILNGETVLLGRLQLIEVITSEDGYITYEVQVTDTVVQFEEALDGLLIKNADFSAYNHTFTSQSIIDSWTTDISGAIYYPLAEYGGQTVDNGLPYATFMSGSDYALPTTVAWDNGLHPYEPIQFLPAIKAKELLNVIFDQVGFRYTGSFTETADFNQIYVLPKGQDGVGPVVNPDLIATFEANEPIGGQAIPTSAFTNLQVSASNEISDPQSQYTAADSYYTTTATGDYIFRGDVSFDNPANGTIDIITYTLTLVKGTYKVSAAVIDTAQITTTEVGRTDTITLAVGGKHTLNSGDDVWMYLTSTGGGVATNVSSSNFECSDAPPSVVGTTLDMGLQFQADTKSIDLLRGLMQQFNLVMVPQKDSSKTIEIETFDTWIRSGEFKDWTEKYNTAERISINHTVDELEKETFLKNADDVDRFSKITIESQPNDQFGTLRLLADNNISQGTTTIGDYFAPVILSGPFDIDFTPAMENEASQSFDFDVDTNNQTVIPHLYKLENKQIQSYAFKPRIGYKVTNTIQYPYQLKIGVLDEATTLSGSYATISNVAALPVVSGSTSDLLFNNTYTPFTDVGFNFRNSKTNYKQYWETYYNSLYWNNSVRVTMDLYFEPYEYHNIELNDRILINNIAYRINKISGFNLTRRDIVTVELLRLYPAYTAFDTDEGSIVTPLPTPSNSPSPTPSNSPTPSVTPSTSINAPSPTPSPSPSSVYYTFSIAPETGTSGESDSGLACNQIVGQNVFFAYPTSPQNGDTAYTNQALTSNFVGDGGWYGIDTDEDGAPNFAFQIDSSGVLSNKTTCT